MHYSKSLKSPFSFPIVIERAALDEVAVKALLTIKLAEQARKKDDDAIGPGEENNYDNSVGPERN